jgi:hypothetical protein
MDAALSKTRGIVCSDSKRARDIFRGEHAQAYPLVAANRKKNNRCKPKTSPYNERKYEILKATFFNHMI